MKHHHQEQVGEERVCLFELILLRDTPSLREVKTETQERLFIINFLCQSSVDRYRKED